MYQRQASCRRPVDCFQPFQQIFFLSIQSNKAIKVFSRVHLVYLSFGWPHHLRNIIAAINVSGARNRVRFDTLGSSGVNGLRTQALLDPSFELKSKLSYALAHPKFPILRNAGPRGLDRHLHGFCHGMAGNPIGKRSWVY